MKSLKSIIKGEQLVRESEHLLQTIGSEANAALRQANSELGACIDEFREMSLQVSKDVNQLQDTVMALFQARYNPIKICDFLLENCLEPLILKPVSLDYSEENPEHVRLTLSYSLKEMSRSLRPSYKKYPMINKYSPLSAVSYIFTRKVLHAHVARFGIQ
ncbi:PREDICTED: centromere/kinetochore protein zw10-like [Rhagoletis zephyria]|uniref:centromere/kinetochore protein zw10-like n=1 Tax=Rhagoletis zephyria TaxID=28612 RepID=UPI0008117ED5|nr:PREDICTED: centromere/kinetochore protein zw10-like [Rhagoletis zephyria]